MSSKYPLALPEGTVLSGQYVIYKVLGQGGFGITYEAIDHKTGGRVAIKEYFPDSLATRNQGQTQVVPYTGDRGENFAYGKECFLQEAETLAEFIGNENIVRIYSYFEEYGTAYFVMDFIEGTNLDEYLRQHGGKISFDEASRILLPVMEALGAVHQKGVVHRDVAPDNIYLTTDGKIKLIDFGAARQSLGDKSQSLDVVLKHGFAPKEQYSRRGRQGPYTDVYALGATFYYVLTGKRPPDSIDRMDEDSLVPPSKLGVAIPKEAEDAILKALRVRAGERFQSMDDFRKAFLSVNLTSKEHVPQEDESAKEIESIGNKHPEQINGISGSVVRSSEMPSDQSIRKKGSPIKILIIILAVIFGTVIALFILLLVMSMASVSTSQGYSDVAPSASVSSDMVDASTPPVVEEPSTESVSKDNEKDEPSSIEEAVSEESSETKAEEAVDTLSLYPIIKGNNTVQNLKNNSFDSNGVGFIRQDGNLTLRCVSNLVLDDSNEYLYGLSNKTGKPLKSHRNRENFQIIDELDDLGEIIRLFISDDYYFALDTDLVMHCVSRIDGGSIGERKIKGAYAFTFSEGYFYLIEGEVGSQYIASVPGGEIDGELTKVYDLPEDCDWQDLIIDGDHTYVVGFHRDDTECCVFYRVDTDRGFWAYVGEVCDLETVTDAEGILYFLCTYDSGEARICYIDFRQNELSATILWEEEGVSPQAVGGLSLLNDGNLCIYNNGAMGWISTSDAKSGN